MSALYMLCVSTSAFGVGEISYASVPRFSLGSGLRCLGFSADVVSSILTLFE